MTFNQFIKECRTHEVFKRISIYVVSSWVLIQVLAVLIDPMGLPKKSVSVLLILLLIGFPIYLFLLWKYDIIKPDNPDHPQEQEAAFSKRYHWSTGVIGLICLSLAGYVFQANFFKSLALASLESSEKIAILKFGNNTGRADLDLVGKMAADWIAHGITENKLGQVVSPEVVSDYKQILQNNASVVSLDGVLKDYFKPARIISGNYFLKGDQLLFQASVLDGDMAETLIAFAPIKCDDEEALECIEALKQRILGFLATNENTLLNLQEEPPKYEAFQLLLDAKNNYDDQELYAELLNRSIAADPTFFEPQVLRVGNYYEQGQFKQADSLLKAIPLRYRNNKRQSNLLFLYESLLKGKNDDVYQAVRNEYEITPFDLPTNSSTMVVAMQYVNRPEDVEPIYKELPQKDILLERCVECKNRYYIMGMAYNALDKPEKTIALLAPLMSEVNTSMLRKPLVMAYLQSKQAETLETLLNQDQLRMDRVEYRDLLLFTAQQAQRLNQQPLALRLYEQVVNLGEKEDLQLVKAQYALNAFAKANEVLDAIAIDHEQDSEWLLYWALIASKLKEDVQVTECLKALNALRGPYQFGEIDYRLAQYEAALGNGTRAMDYLQKAIAQGDQYTIDRYNKDPFFATLTLSPQFFKIMNYWKPKP
ncbi:tetratricopeptide repeat protein [Croceiramulus getboli]|nr:hypothetical protein P8624_11985 [Flavobacteriaceae bacterium YJPT1-3]